MRSRFGAPYRSGLRRQRQRVRRRDRAVSSLTDSLVGTLKPLGLSASRT
jgi:hypothetical protein